jgi:hypothetical protein
MSAAVFFAAATLEKDTGVGDLVRICNFISKSLQLKLFPSLESVTNTFTELDVIPEVVADKYLFSLAPEVVGKCQVPFQSHNSRC